MKRFITTAIILMLVSACFGAADIKEQDKTTDRIIKATVNPEKGSVGTVFRYTVAVAGSDLKELKIELPQKRIIFPEEKKPEKKDGSVKKGDEPDGAASVPLFIIHRALKDDALSDGGGQISVILELSGYRPGKHTLPEISIKDSSGISIGYKLPAVEITPSNAGGQLEDIEAPLDLSGNYTRLILLILGVIALTLGGVFLYRYIKRRRTVVPEPERSIPPIEKFLKEVQDLDLSGRITRGEINEYVFSVSILFRRYLSSLYGFDAAEMTTDEISRRLKRYMQGEGLSDFSGDIIKSMHLWDLSKFAEFSPSSELLLENLESTIGIAKKISSFGEETDGKL